MTDPVDQKLSDLPLVTPNGSDLLYAVHSANSSKATAAAVAALLFTATGVTGCTGAASVVTGNTGPTGTDSVVTGPDGPTGAQSVLTGDTGPTGAQSIETGPTGADGNFTGPTGDAGAPMVFVQATPTPSLAVVDDGEITVTHPATDVVPVAKIKVGLIYNPAVLGRTGSPNVDVEVTHPSDTTTVFKNVTGDTNDFIFEVLPAP